MLKASLLILSTCALVPALDAAAIKEPVITAIAWHPDSTKVAVGLPNGALTWFTWDSESTRWIVSNKSPVDDRMCSSCNRPVGITSLVWNKDGALQINGHIKFNLSTGKAIKKPAEYVTTCFRCAHHTPPNAVSEEASKTFCSASPDKKFKLVINSYVLHIEKNS